MKKGFTLAEVLITLGIIGVVSALSLPSLVGNYQEKVMISQLQKNYNMIRNTVPNAMTEEGVTSSWELVGKDAQKNINFLRKYFEVSAVCKYKGYDKCLAPTYTNLKGASLTAEQLAASGLKTSSKGACAMAATGATICVSEDMNWLIDVNGPKAPNKFGRDVFWFELDKGAKPMLSTESRLMGSSTYDANKDNKLLNGEYCIGTNNTKDIRLTSCLAKVIANGWKLD